MSLGLFAFDPFDVLGLRLAAPVSRHLAHLVLAHPGALHAARDVGGGDGEEHVALADEALGSLLVEDDPAVGEGGHGEGEAGGDVGLDDAGDDVDGRTLGGDHQVDADGPGHLGDAADRVLDVTSRHHHEVVELVDHDKDERQALEVDIGSRLR